MISRQRQWQIKQQTQGKCIICAKRAINKSFCEYHRLQTLVARRNKRKERKSKGICEQCNNPIDPSNSTYCSKHLDRRRKYNNAYYRRHKDE